LTTVVIISFVAFFSPRSQRGISRSAYLRSDVVGSINGKPLHRGQYFDAYKEATLRYLLSYNRWPGEDEMSRQLGVVDRETKSRLLLLEKMKQMKIEVSDEAVADWIVQAFQDRNQHIFHKEAYDRFVNETLPAKGITPDDFKRFARNEVGIQQVVAVTGAAGRLVTPQEAEVIYRHENEMVDTEIVAWSSSNYLSKVTVDPTALATFYTNRQSSYRLPERLKVNFVKFDQTNYLADAEKQMSANTNMSRVIDATYAQRATNYVDSTGKPLAPEAAKEKIRSEIREELALVEARRKAIEFQNELIGMNPLVPENLEKLAATKGLPLGVTEPFGQYEQPKMADAPENMGRIAFELTPTEPFPEQPLVSEHAAYVIGVKQRVPSELPSLDSIREKVTEDFRRSRATEMAQADGRQFYGVLTNSLAQGQTFDAVAKASHLTPVDLPPFAQNTFSLAELGTRTDMSTLKTVAFALQPGHASSFTPTPGGGIVVYLQAKVPVADAKVQAELPEYLKNLRQSRQYEAFNDWFRHEMETAHIVLPSDKKDQAVAN
jgi:peptidyl-prolyl cis-trans isomerase D